MRRDERDLPGCFWVCVLLMAGWGASAAGQCGVEERGQHGRVPAASTEAGEEREIPACSDAPADTCERRAGPDVSAVDLPGSAGGPVVAHGVRVAPHIRHATRQFQRFQAVQLPLFVRLWFWVERVQPLRGRVLTGCLCVGGPCGLCSGVQPQRVRELLLGAENFPWIPPRCPAAELG